MFNLVETTIMNKTKAIDMIMREMREEIEAFMAIEDQIQTGLEYEDRVIEITRSLGQKLLRGSGEVESRGKNSKKNS
jgi:hypothetical protein